MQLPPAGEPAHAAAPEVPERIERLLAQVRALEDELQRLQAKQAVADAGDLVAEASDGVIVVRRDGLASDELRRIALEHVRALGLGCRRARRCAPDGKKAAIAVAVSKDLVEQGVSADAIGGPGRQGARRRRRARTPTSCRAAARTSTRLDDALALARDQAASGRR